MCLGSLASPKLSPSEPEEPFEPVGESCDEPPNGSDDNRSMNCASSVAPSLSTSSALLSSLSPAETIGTSRGDALATRKLNESIGAAGDGKREVETTGNLQSSTEAANMGASLSSTGGPQFVGGARGGKPSAASRLSFVDRKWLERCQVFGEMGDEVMPGAGNQEIQLEKKGGGGAEVGEGRENELKIQGDERGGKDEKEAEGETRGVGREEVFTSVTSDKIVTSDAPKPGRHARTSRRGGEEEEVTVGDGEQGEMSPPAPEYDGETSPKSKGTKKKGRKRRREGENSEGDMTQEGGVKKRRRNAKKDTGSDVNPNPAPEGGRKRRAKKKVEEGEEAEDEKETRIKEKVPQENLLGEIEEEFGSRRFRNTQPAR